MATIRILDDHLVSQIAAGEVIERPASVVKELVENALDAAASSLKIELESGGKRRIRVSDDGVGMDSEDALLAFDRHATSKIARFDDLQRIETLGFRGEALAAIAAVARVELTTAIEPGTGFRVAIEGGRIRAAEPAPHPSGTRVEVASLFFNVPARRKFLKTTRTELRRCTEVVQGYALAHPQVTFTLAHEGKLLLDTLQTAGGGEGARARIADIFGEQLAGHLVEIEGSDASGESIWGFVGDATTTRGRRYFTFVNRRLLRDRALMAGFYAAVREEWRSEEFPALFLFVDLPPTEVDVNVHPQKAEVRFRDSRLLERLSLKLRGALHRGLGEGEVAPLRQPVGLHREPLSWQGLGGRLPNAHPESSIRRADGTIREPAADWTPGAATRLADVAYAPVETRCVPLSGRRGERRRVRLLGQYKGSIILLEGPGGMLLVDQHVAHERILYERLRRSLRREVVVSQGLVEPLLLELGPSEAMRLAELQDELEACGFSLREMSGRSVALQAAPAVLSPREAEETIVTLAAAWTGKDEGPEGIRDSILDALAASQSCRAAIKIHHPLTAAEMEALVTELFEAEQPYMCPHGRPIVLELTDADLERRFGRR